MRSFAAHPSSPGASSSNPTDRTLVYPASYSGFVRTQRKAPETALESGQLTPQAANTCVSYCTRLLEHAASMDEPTFQHALHQLKQKITEMSQRHHISPVANYSDPSIARDTFAAQLSDVKLHLDLLQRSLDQNHVRFQDNVTWQAAAGNAQSTRQAPHRNNLTLPSGPLFWQLFSSLRSHVQGLDSRVASVEHNVWELEDRVDNLDPHRFTPPGSTGSNDAPTSDWGVGALNSSEMQPSTDFQTAYKADQQYRGSLSDVGREYELRAVIQPFAWNHSYTTAADSRDMALPELAPCLATQPRSIEGVEYRDRELSRMDELLRNAQESSRASEQQLAEKDAMLSGLRQTLASKERDVESLTTQLEDRTDQVRAVEDSHQKMEDYLEMVRSDAHSKMETINSLNRAYSHLSSECEELRLVDKQALNKLKDAQVDVETLQALLRSSQNSRDDEFDEMLTIRDEEIRRLQEFCEQKDAVTCEQERVMARGAQLLTQKDTELETLSHSLEAAKESNDGQTRGLARMRTLLHQQNGELANLSEKEAQIKGVLERPLQTSHEEEAIAELAARLLCISQADGKSVLSSQIHRLAEGDSVRNVLGVATPDNDRTGEDGHHLQPSPFAHAGQFISDRRPREQWTPSRLSSKRLPHEARRASYWEGRHHERTRPVFGRPSPIGTPVRHGQQYDDSDSRIRPTSPEASQLSTFNSVADRRATPLPERVNVDSPDAGILPRSSVRHRLPLDRTFWPPLPAPVAHKVSTVSDLRSAASRGRGQRTVSKHRSMLELPRRNLQAYVETENESGGELGGEV